MLGLFLAPILLQANELSNMCEPIGVPLSETLNHNTHAQRFEDRMC